MVETHRFSTPLGVCRVEWSERGVRGLRLPTPGLKPDRSPAPGPIGAVVDRVRRHLSGDPQPLHDVPLDLEHAAEFDHRVWMATRTVRAGETATYGEIARLVGSPGAARAVGSALRRNPVPLFVPCHRVIGATGALTGFSCDGGVALKTRLLRLEGTPMREPHARAVAHLRHADATLAALIDGLPPCDLPAQPRPGAFRWLARAVVHQQLSPRAGDTIWGRAAPLLRSPSTVLAAPAARLRACGLSRAKVAAVRDLAERVRSGRLRPGDLRREDDESVIARLIEVRGVGRWTAEMFLIFCLGRLDVLSLGDQALRSTIREVYGIRAEPSDRRVLALAASWRPYRSVASWYLWRHRDA